MKENRLWLELAQYEPEVVYKTEKGKVHIFDPIRDKYLIKTPEEIVRQLAIVYLTKKLKWPIELIAVEKLFLIGERRKRFDILCFNTSGKPIFLIECKSPKVPVSLSTFEQASNYNLALKAPYYLVTNGMSDYCLEFDLENKNYWHLKVVPTFKEIGVT